MHDFLAPSYQVSEGLFACCRPFRPPCILCVLACAVCLRACVRSESVCVCLHGPPARVLIGLALPSWVPDPGQAPSCLAAKRVSQPV